MPTLAFFGATGGCAKACLVHALSAGYDTIALARTPSKLTALLRESGVKEEDLDNHLTIVDGNVKDTEAVKRALVLNGKVVDIIISGIGSTPKLQFSLFRPVTLHDPTVCNDAVCTILSALSELKCSTKPLFAMLSTTGITTGPRDVPILYLPIYHWLAVPHEDKRLAENVLSHHAHKPEQERIIKGYVSIRPTLLADGDSLGIEKVKVGLDDKPALGYRIRRNDVGLWIFEELLKKRSEDKFLNRGVTLTY
ncbi:MAG: hypothetical protein M1834_007361 [Cirrosporium novae-zelandiae]|nr:MAG: hypothetical protein M1834_007361 [Cirrosporium novae-zelandiae]